MRFPSGFHVDFSDAQVLFERSYANSERSSVEDVASGVCWLCDRQAPEVTFKKTAHVMPQSLGNKAWITRNECDDCNEHIGRHESALVASLAGYRATSMARAKRPKFKDPKTGSFMLSPDEQKNIVIHEPNTIGGVAELVANAELTLRVPVDGYRPFSICKTLARLALLLVPQARRTHRHLRKWILGTLVLPDQVLVTGETKHGETFTPTVRILRRMAGDVPHYAVAMSYGGCIYWYALPRNCEVVTSIFIDRAMFEHLLHLSWDAELLSESRTIASHQATITLLHEPAP